VLLITLVPKRDLITVCDSITDVEVAGAVQIILGALLLGWSNLKPIGGAGSVAGQSTPMQGRQDWAFAGLIIAVAKRIAAIAVFTSFSCCLGTMPGCPK
jgi:hypothetical protein